MHNANNDATHVAALLPLAHKTLVFFFSAIDSLESGEIFLFQTVKNRYELWTLSTVPLSLSLFPNNSTGAWSRVRSKRYDRVTFLSIMLVTDIFFFFFWGAALETTPKLFITVHWTSATVYRPLRNVLRESHRVLNQQWTQRLKHTIFENSKRWTRSDLRVHYKSNNTRDLKLLAVVVLPSKCYSSMYFFCQ